MDPRTVAIVILLVAFAGFGVAYLVVGPGRRRGARPTGDIPLALRPYHSDDELETTGLERAMAWGVAFVLFMALFLPVYWLTEPIRINQLRAEFYEHDVAMGRQLYAEACAQCHGVAATGGFASHPDPAVDAPWPAPALNTIVARYEDDPNVFDIRDFVVQTVKQGRPGTPMPPWSTAFGAGFNDQQIETIVAYILAIQEDEAPEPEAFAGQTGAQIFGAACARCHGPGAEGYVAPALLDVFARYGADGTPVGDAAAEAAIRYTILHGRVVPGYADMPAHRHLLTEDAIDRVIDYLWAIQ